jgi:glycogen synthase
VAWWPRLPHTLASAQLKGSFNILRYMVNLLKTTQSGHGLVTVSPGYALQMRQKLSAVWDLPPGVLISISNAMDIPSSSLSANYDFESLQQLPQVLGDKRGAKQQLQTNYGLNVDAHLPVVVFLGRLTEQKVRDADRHMKHRQDVSVLHLGGSPAIMQTLPLNPSP